MRSLALGALMTLSHGIAHGQHHHNHGNPDDLDAYIAKMEDPSRDEWQKPDEVLRVLKLGENQTACDIGAGPGYFALRMARIVGAKGHVCAVDVEPRILAALRDRISKAAVRDVTPVLALEGDPLLPPASCDRILISWRRPSVPASRSSTSRRSCPSSTSW
jgi:tRNA G46 methylase TrmB